MSKLGSFILGATLGVAAGLVAGTLLDDEKVSQLKSRLKDSDALNSLKEKYDNGTELVKNQLSSIPKAVEDYSELKDFDDIVIDGHDEKPSQDEESSSDLDHAE